MHSLLLVVALTSYLSSSSQKGKGVRLDINL